MDLKNGTEVRVRGPEHPGELQQWMLTLGPTHAARGQGRRAGTVPTMQAGTRAPVGPAMGTRAVYHQAGMLTAAGGCRIARQPPYAPLFTFLLTIIMHSEVV